MLPEAFKAGQSFRRWPPPPLPASKTERIKICIFLCLPLLSCQSCFTCCHPMLSFICVRRKDLTSSVYSVHLARQIFHTNFEEEMKLSFNRMRTIIFGQTYYEREHCRTLFPRTIPKSLIRFLKSRIWSPRATLVGGNKQHP